MALTSDTFNGDTLKNTWTETDPTSALTTSVADGRLTMTIAGGASHDLIAGTETAGRILQSHDDSDFDITIQFTTYDMGSLASGFKDNGFIIWQQSAVWIRFGMFLNASGTSFFIYRRNFEGATTLVNTSIGANTPYYLRIIRADTSWTYQWSADGTSWTTITTDTFTITVNSLGIYAANGSGGSTLEHSRLIEQWIDNDAGPEAPESGDLEGSATGTLAAVAMASGTLAAVPMASGSLSAAPLAAGTLSSTP